MTDPLKLMELHVEALFRLDASGRLVSVNEPGGGPAPRFFLGRTPDGPVWRVRQDIRPEVAAELGALVGAEAVGPDPAPEPAGAKAYRDVLSRDEAVRGTWSGPAYRFPPMPAGAGGTVRVTTANASLLAARLEDWMADVRAGSPMVVAVDEGSAVSLCCSVRMTDRAHEAGVETHPDFRGQGLAGRVVAAWAEWVRESGRTPLYSTSWDNAASRRVARKLGLVQYGSDFHIT